jgi:pyrroloquinoline quinone biosynthesis protein B
MLLLTRPALLALVVASLACAPASTPSPVSAETGPFLLVLGIAQDGGYPQAGCEKECCRPAWEEPSRRRDVASVAVVDPGEGRGWMVDATPDFRGQLRALTRAGSPEGGIELEGILLTHAHAGHYTGLLHLGREVMGAGRVPVWAMPRLRAFLEGSGPWSQLVELGNIELRPLEKGRAVELTAGVAATPFLVPHRDEYSETIGLWIEGPRRRVLYIPDIDKWERWDLPLEESLAEADVALLDGTFFDEGELPGRDMSEIPHPFIVETMERLSSLPRSEREKVRFTHLNHTNPALASGSAARETLESAGFRVARQGERIPL